MHLVSLGHWWDNGRSLLRKSAPYFLLLSLLASASLSRSAYGQPFLFPTANRALLETNGADNFFVGTVGKPWTSGMFGCVRTDGWQMHEGIDIKCLQRDRRGEPTDSVMATADGTVVYVNTKPSLSNYGNYVILRHRIEGLEIYSLYAHLSEVRSDLKTGLAVKSGEAIATMGRTSNTRQAISKERAHVHFELNLFVNERFSSWYTKTFSNQRNDHGDWNGQNLIGLDPRLILLAQAQPGSKFSLLDFLRHQTELCRVLVRSTQFAWLKRYTPLVRRNPVAEKEGVAGYEVAFNFNGLPFQLIPRAPSEIKGQAKFQLLSVNEDEYRKHPCRRLVIKKGDHWELAAAGNRLLDLLTH
jgi:murein DD-endopeptidase MepM/ murein hydrolase activator NlpD